MVEGPLLGEDRVAHTLLLWILVAVAPSSIAAERTSLPQPADGARQVDAAHLVLRWARAPNSVRQRIFFGPSEAPLFQEEMTRLEYEPGPLLPGTTYSWRVDQLTTAGMVIGPTWKFTTAAGTKKPSEAVVPWSQCMRQPEAWYATPAALSIADNVLLYQRRTGGWPKNIDMAVPLTMAGHRDFYP